ncbi:MAG: polysaccharide deacetylase family protein, partial [Cyanobacteria bacterium REEB65]|nr:polysaccharide deacetylase family protein [Cyanobacteria bacterium REEB65]
MWNDRRVLLASTVALVGVVGIAIAVTRPQSLPPSAPSTTQTASRHATPGVTALPANSAPTVASLPVAFKVQPNELGMVPILEYHGVEPAESRWARSISNFKGDLLWLYEHGYVSQTVQDMLNGFPDVPAGKKPVVFTFDDARKDQFTASGVDAKGLAIPTPTCAVGLMMDFAKTHPGFGHRASFYLLPSFFEENPTIGAKLKFLEANGFELGNHTWTHLMMRKATPDRIRNEIARLQGAVDRYLGPSFKTVTLAAPDGSMPKTPAQIA